MNTQDHSLSVRLLLNIGHGLDHMFLLIFAASVGVIASDFGFQSWEDLMPYGVGAFLLFGAIQVTMIGHGIWKGERLHKLQLAGLTLAFAGLVGLLLPGLSAPPLFGAAIMLSAGVAWGIYSLRGRGAGDPTRVTAGNFTRAVPIALALSLVLLYDSSLDWWGVTYAIVSGALTSGIGYVIWYTALPGLKATQAAIVQLSVPVLVAVGGTIFLGEPITLQLVLAATAILGGIALVILEKQLA